MNNLCFSSQDAFLSFKTYPKKKFLKGFMVILRFLGEQNRIENENWLNNISIFYEYELQFENTHLI